MGNERVNRLFRLCATALVLVVPSLAATRAADLPDAIAAKDAVVVVEFHAEGAQIYECKPDAAGQLGWRFREPVASLFHEDVTVGRHYAGPTWETGGSAVVGKVAAQAPGEGAKDIPWLKLVVSERRGDGVLKDVTAVQRINTRGGVLNGRCDKAATLRAEPYAADYVFLRKAP